MIGGNGGAERGNEGGAGADWGIGGRCGAERGIWGVGGAVWGIGGGGGAERQIGGVGGADRGKELREQVSFSRGCGGRKV